jgi:5-methylcytosine-specific restriction endonuclease McrA
MKFRDTTKDEARFRQYGNCGLCGDNLDWQEEFAHHVHPDALGGSNDVENCVILCRPCHERAHCDGRFRSGIVAPRRYFRHWYG